MSKKASILQLNGGVQYPILGIEKNIPQDNRTQDRSKAHENNTRTVVASMQRDRQQSAGFFPRATRCCGLCCPSCWFILLSSAIHPGGIWLAFTRFDFRLGFFGSPFVGLDNFQYLFKSGILWQLVRNTVLYNLAFLIIGNILQIVCAIFLSELMNKLFVKISQSVIFLPYFISMVLVGLFSYALFNVDNGLINTVLRSLGLQDYNFYLNANAWPPSSSLSKCGKGLVTAASSTCRSSVVLRLIITRQPA